MHHCVVMGSTKWIFMDLEQSDDLLVALHHGDTSTHYHTMTPFEGSGKEAFRKHCGKRRNYFYQHFFPFTTMFFFYSIRQKLLFSTNAFILVWSKFFSCGNGLSPLLTEHDS